MKGPWAIALDLGGTQIRAALVNAEGQVKNRVAVATASQAAASVVVGQLAEAAHAASKDEASSNIIGVGLSSPGPLDTEKGLALSLPNIPALAGVALRADLEAAVGHKVWLENDGISAAIGEWKHGAGKGLRSLVYVTVSTGIGGGVIVDGHVLRGRKGMAGHVGHICIVKDGIRCGCGNPGCLEAYAAGPAFAARAARSARLEPRSTLHAMAESLSPADVFAAAAAGDELAKSLVQEEATLLGVGITSLLHLFSPQAIIVGGGLSNSFDQLHPGIMAYVTANAIPAFRDVPVMKAALGGNSGLVGAAALVFEGQ